MSTTNKLIKAKKELSQLAYDIIQSMDTQVATLVKLRIAIDDIEVGEEDDTISARELWEFIDDEFSNFTPEVDEEEINIELNGRELSIHESSIQITNMDSLAKAIKRIIEGHFDTKI